MRSDAIGRRGWVSCWGSLGLVLLMTLGATAQPGTTTGFSFLRLEPAARAAALGGAFGAISDQDVNVAFYNPAGLRTEMNGRISVSYLNHLSAVKAGFVAYGHTLENIGDAAVSLRFLGYGSIERAGLDGTRDGTTFGANDVALSFSLAREHAPTRIRYGATLHGILSTIDTHRASALALDLGILYRLSESETTFSLTAHHIGLVLHSFGAIKDELPFDVRAGFSTKLEGLPLRLSLTAYNLHDYTGDTGSVLNRALRHLAIGGEFAFGTAFNLRFGYNHRRHEELKIKTRLDLAGFGVGFGIHLKRFTFDYAFNSWSSLGGLHQLTLATNL